MSLLFPRRCPVCEEVVGPGQRLICEPCLSVLSPVKQPACRSCGKEVFADRLEYCRDCSCHPKTFREGMALLNYNEAARRSMAAIKYKNRREYLDFYSQVIGHRFGKRIQRISPDVLIPVPVHSSRKKQRGFNQAEELAVRLGRIWDLPVDTGLLIRKKKTDPQKQLTPKERLHNLEDAFALAGDGDAAGIPDVAVLVDDIYTTGSTLEACARILKAAGTNKIYTLVICIGEGAS